MMSPQATIELVPRGTGRPGARDHLLVLPSVICAARVAREVADAVGARALGHQHGCSQVGDDAARTGAAFAGLACNPNVAGVVVVSLGCETLQGDELAARIGERRGEVELVGIQHAGGALAARDAGIEAAGRLQRTRAEARRESVPASGLLVGIEVSRPSDLSQRFVELALSHGASVVLASDREPSQLPTVEAISIQPFSPAPADLGGSPLIEVEGAGQGPQQHVAFVCAGAQAIVAFPADVAAPVGFPVCPVVNVAGSSPLHRALAADFDTDDTASPEQLWQLLVATVEGRPTAAERIGSETFALDRITRVM